MADIVSTPTTSAEVSSLKKVKKTTKTAGEFHPPTAVMVTNAIKHLKERGGSSLQAIKKFIVSTYKIDAEKLSPFIKRYIKFSVVEGKLIQTKGKGASGSFKLATVAITKAPAKKKAAAKKLVRTAAVKKTKVVPAEKPAASATTTATKKSPVKEATKGRKAAVVAVEKKATSSIKAKLKTVAAKPKKIVAKSSPAKKTKSPKAKTTTARKTARSPKKPRQKRSELIVRLERSISLL